MTDSTTEYLERLGQRTGTFESLPKKLKGTVRFDIERDKQTDYWFITFDDGNVQVSRDGHDPDFVVRAKQGLFDRLVSGDAQIASSMMRNELVVEGDMRLIMMVGRLFPGPPGAHHPRTGAAAGERRES